MTKPAFATPVEIEGLALPDVEHVNLPDGAKLLDFADGLWAQEVSRPEFDGWVRSARHRRDADGILGSPEHNRAWETAWRYACLVVGWQNIRNFRPTVYYSVPGVEDGPADLVCGFAVDAINGRGNIYAFGPAEDLRVCWDA